MSAVATWNVPAPNLIFNSKKLGLLAAAPEVEVDGGRLNDTAAAPVEIEDDSFTRKMQVFRASLEAKALAAVQSSMINRIFQVQDRSAVDKSAYNDAIAFARKLDVATLPDVITGTDEGEIIIEWLRSNDRLAVVFEGAGEFGYAYTRDGRVRAGEHVGDPYAEEFQRDISEYLKSLPAR